MKFYLNAVYGTNIFVEVHTMQSARFVASSNIEMTEANGIGNPFLSRAAFIAYRRMVNGLGKHIMKRANWDISEDSVRSKPYMGIAIQIGSALVQSINGGLPTAIQILDTMLEQDKMLYSASVFHDSAIALEKTWYDVKVQGLYNAMSVEFGTDGITGADGYMYKVQDGRVLTYDGMSFVYSAKIRAYETAEMVYNRFSRDGSGIISVRNSSKLIDRRSYRVGNSTGVSMDMLIRKHSSGVGVFQRGGKRRAAAW